MRRLHWTFGASTIICPSTDGSTLLAKFSTDPTRRVFPAREDSYFFSSSVRCFVKSSMARWARAAPFTTVTTSRVLGTPSESRIDFRTSQGEVLGFRRGTGTEGILATQAVRGYDTEGSLLARFQDRFIDWSPEKPRVFGMKPANGD